MGFICTLLSKQTMAFGTGPSVQQFALCVKTSGRLPLHASADRPNRLSFAGPTLTTLVHSPHLARTHSIEWCAGAHHEGHHPIRGLPASGPQGRAID